MVTIRDDDDGASSVLAVVLMMGFVAAASVSLFVVGTATVDETRDTAQENQVENTFRQFNKDVSSVAFGRQKYRSMEFDIEDQTAAFRQENTGRIRVVNGTTEVVNKTVGSLVYEKGGETIAYQAGGVWRGTGKESRMVSRPPVEYQNGSLTFPIPALDGDESVHAGELDINKLKTESPINDDSYVKGELVTLYITSEYYMGWAEYFRSQTNDVAVEVDHSPPGEMGTVKVKLGQPVANGDFENGVLATGGDDGDIVTDSGNAEITGPVAATGEVTDGTGGIADSSPEENVESGLFELDEAIQRKVNDALTNGSIHDEQIDSGDELQNGKTYYDNDGFTLNSGTMQVDLSGGNVTLIVDGDMTLNGGNINVQDHGTDNVFRIYTTGDLSMKNSYAGDADDEDARHFQIYGNSTMLMAMNGGSGSHYIGTVYAPRDEAVLDDTDSNPALLSGSGCKGYDFCVIKGNSKVTGALVGGPTEIGQSASMIYDSNLGSVEPTLQLPDGVLPPPITFLKVSVHTVAVNNSGANHLAPAGGVGAPASVASPPAATGFASVDAPSDVMAAPAVRAETAFDR